MLRAHAANLLGSFTALDGTALEVGGGGQPLLVMLRTEAELGLPLVASRLLARIGLEQAGISLLSRELTFAGRPVADLVVVASACSALHLSRSFALGHLAATLVRGQHEPTGVVTRAPPHLTGNQLTSCDLAEPAKVPMIGCGRCRAGAPVPLPPCVVHLAQAAAFLEFLATAHATLLWKRRVQPARFREWTVPTPTHEHASGIVPSLADDRWFNDDAVDKTAHQSAPPRHVHVRPKFGQVHRLADELRDAGVIAILHDDGGRLLDSVSDLRAHQQPLAAGDATLPEVGCQGIQEALGAGEFGFGLDPAAVTNAGTLRVSLDLGGRHPAHDGFVG